MEKLVKHKRIKWPLVCGVIVGLLAMAATVSLATAAPIPEAAQAPQPEDSPNCGTCHQDVSNSWSQSPHAHAFDDPVFQERWQGLGQPGDCLLCHTTHYQATSGEFSEEGVSCEACHGKVDANHPPAPAPTGASTEYCGTCHTTTLGEWRLTGHSAANVGCTDCHDPHNQQALFEDPDQMCINCHKDSMGPYLEDMHAQKDIGCVDCHALVIPPETPPVDGIVPTGHAFTITPATCVACHTDALHAGFSLPGYERGAKAANGNADSAKPEVVVPASQTSVTSPREQIQLLETEVQHLQATVASRSMTILFQGGVVGLVLGASTAWVVAQNIRRGRNEEEEDEDSHGENEEE